MCTYMLFALLRVQLVLISFLKSSIKDGFGAHAEERSGTSKVLDPAEREQGKVPLRNYRTPQTSLFEDYRREGKYFKIGILYWKVRTTLDHGKRKLSGLAFFLDEEGRLVCSSLICFSFLKELEKKTSSSLVMTLCVCVCGDIKTLPNI